MNDQTKLKFTFDDDKDGTGKLLIEAAANGFAGKGEAYFSLSQIEDFADSLSAYPLKKENLPALLGVRQESFSIKAYPTNGRGTLAIQIRLMTDLWDGDTAESQHSVQLEIPTHYGALAAFSKEIKELMKGQISEASLRND